MTPTSSPAPRSPGPPEPAVLDRSALLARLGGNRRVLAEVAEAFTEESAGYLGAIREGLRAGDAAGVRRAAHSLAGAAGLLAAETACGAARQLEALGEAGDLAQAAVVYAGLEEAVRLLLPALAALRDEGP